LLWLYFLNADKCQKKIQLNNLQPARSSTATRASHPMNFITTNRVALFLRLNTTLGEVIAAKISAGTVLTTIKNADSLPQKALEKSVIAPLIRRFSVS
jgi:hypothetical protein